MCGFGQYTVDLGAHPFVPDGWTVKEHSGSGQLVVNIAHIERYFPTVRNWSKIQKEIARNKKIMLNANVLDFLLAHPELIPEEWKEQRILFGGTVYEMDGRAVVRYLYFRGSTRKWDWFQIAAVRENWTDGDYLAVLRN